MEKIKDTVFSWVASKDLMFQIISWVVGPIFFTNIPIIYFLVYMKENHFFSYDFFVNGLFGLNVFFIVTAFFMIIFAFGFVGALIPLYKVVENCIYMRKTSHFLISQLLKKGSFINFVILLIMNIVFIYTLIKTENYQKFPDAYNYIFSLGIVICIYLTSLFFWKGIFKFLGLLLLIIFSLVCCLYAPKITSEIIKIGLDKFNVGGDVKVSIRKESDNTIITDGNLTLLSPNQIYIKTSEGAKILERSGKIIVFSKNDGE